LCEQVRHRIAKSGTAACNVCNLAFEPTCHVKTPMSRSL
jgi:hypothetical protein